MDSAKMQNDFMKEFFNMQEKGIEMWKDGMEKAKEIYPSTFSQINNFINPVETYEKWGKSQKDFSFAAEENPMTTLNSWIKKNQEIFANNINPVESNEVKDVFNKMSEGMISYNKLFTFWQDLQNQMGEENTLEKKQEFINKWRDNYIKMLSDRVLLELPPHIIELAKEPMKVFKIYNDYNFMEPFNIGSKEYLKKNPFSDKQYVESYEVYTNTLREFFTVFRKKAMETMETIVIDYQKIIENGNVPKTFNEFYDYWFNKNNEVVNEILGTDEFSKLLAKLSKDSLNYKKNHENILEKQLKWMPFPLKSEMRSLYKTIYDLRKEVKSLRKQIYEMEKGNK